MSPVSPERSLRRSGQKYLAAMRPSSTAFRHEAGRIVQTGRQPSLEDFVDISNVVGKYQWLVDEGDSQGWPALFTTDGIFEGGTPEPYQGKEQLSQIPSYPQRVHGCAMRHHTGSLFVEYGANADEACARYYCLVLSFAPKTPPKLFCLSLYSLFLVRQQGEWKIKRASPKIL
jgi:hypothetical protein